MLTHRELTRRELDIAICAVHAIIVFCFFGVQACLIGLYLIGASSLVIGFGCFVSASYSALVVSHFNYAWRHGGHLYQVRASAYPPSQPVGQPAYQYDLDLLGSVRYGGPSDRQEEWRCAICLCNSVGDNEKLRELNACKHVFHHE